MAYQMSRKQLIFSMVYGQSMIAMLTILNVFYPEYLGYTWIIFLVGMVVFMGITMKSQLKHITSKEAKTIKEGRLLYKSKLEEVRELQAQDKLLVEELKPMMKSAGLSFVGMIIMFVWYFLYFPFARDFATQAEDLYLRLGVFLLGYELPYVTITLLNLISRRSIKETVQVLNSYEIYDKGVLGMGLTVTFPIDPKSNYKVLVDPDRKFVEFIFRQGRMLVRYRLYTKSVKRVADLIKRYGKPPEMEYVTREA
ncbi:MAG: hypothetical protein DRO10_01160 [Thermoprotei archaeon]|nr:MAG: hypothetical protein DRO10_01160 [Thermoprotei archaeon]